MTSDRYVHSSDALEFDDFYREHIGALVAGATLVVGNRLMAEDLAQEALIKALVHWPRIQKYEQPGAWVRRVMIRDAAQLGAQVPGAKMTTEQVKALVTALQDIVAVLADADPAQRAAVYNDLGVTLTYTPDGTVGVQAHPRGVQVRVGGGT